MAEKKYLDYTALSYYDGKIKTYLEEKDAAVLASAKSYADGLAVNYDAAGTAQTKVDALANGQVKANTEAIAKLNGAATEEGSVAKAVADSAATLTAAIEAVEAKADAAQGDVDALEALVGSLPEGADATTVVEYVNKKTEGIATDAALSELQGKVTEAQEAIDAIEADYLVEADKTALQDQITENAEAIEAIESDYLKAADKTELQGNIDKKADQTALEAEISRAKAAEEKNAADIALILNNPDTDVVDSINEFITYVAEHGEVATGLQTQITENKTAVEGEVTRATTAEGVLSGRLDVLEAIDHDAYKAADTTLSETLMGEINKKADASVVSEMDAAYKLADTNLGNRVTALETAGYATTGEVETAKQAAISAAAADATTKAGQALTDAKAYTDEEIDKVEANVSANAGDITALKGRMDTAEGEIDALQEAIGEGGSVTVAIAEAKKAGTDAQGEVDALEGVVETLSGKVSANEGSLSAHGDRLTALETKVGDGFVAITNAEIDSLFTKAAQ